MIAKTAVMPHASRTTDYENSRFETVLIDPHVRTYLFSTNKGFMVNDGLLGWRWLL